MLGRNIRFEHLLLHVRLSFTSPIPYFLCAATEFRSFILYYPIVLCGILPDCFVAHLLLLSKAMRILLGDAILLSDLDLAQELLNLFCDLYEKYYGKLIVSLYCNSYAIYMLYLLQACDIVLSMCTCSVICRIMSEFMAPFGLIRPFHLKMQSGT